MSRSESELLSEALHHFEYVDRYALLDLTSDVVIDALALRLSAILDTLGRLPVGTLDDMFGNLWPAMRGLRNRIAHGYLAVDREALHITIQDELPHVRSIIEHRLRQSTRGGDTTESGPATR